jgi:iron complex outermembrane receptor protein
MSRLVLTASALAISSAAFVQPVLAEQSSKVPNPTVPADPANEDKNNDGVPDREETRDGEQIVVTGTLVRGIAPVGANVVGLGQEEIQASTATDTNQLITELPQSQYFLQLPQPSEGVAAGISRVPVNRVNLRNVPGSTTSSGSPTLVLMDGHAIVPLGVEQSVVDVGVVPSGILNRAEAILDGSSALYGSDAVGGVLNFITRKRFEGLQTNFRYSVADGYHAFNADVTTGTDWGSGGIALTYSYAENSQLLNGDRDYSLIRNYLDGGRFTGLYCDTTTNVSTGSGAGQRRFTTELGSTILVETTPSPKWCPSNYWSSLTPAQTRHGGFVALTQDLADNIRFDLTGFYFHRVTQSNFGPFTSTVSVRPNNPYYRPIPGATTATQTVSINYGPALGFDTAKDHIISEVYQITPSLEVGLGT